MTQPNPDFEYWNAPVEIPPSYSNDGHEQIADALRSLPQANSLRALGLGALGISRSNAIHNDSPDGSLSQPPQPRQGNLALPGQGLTLTIETDATKLRITFESK